MMNMSSPQSDTMQAMVLEAPGQPLQLKSLPLPQPEDKQVLIRVIACGVCRTDLHIIDGELKTMKLPLVPGHEVVGVVIEIGPGCKHLEKGDIVGVPWLAHTCGNCKYCRSNRENLCENASFTGYSVDGGYATHMIAWEAFCFPMPGNYSNVYGAPLLCAGLIGFRAFRMIDKAAMNIGIYGFGAAAHILTQIAQYQGRNIYAFTKPGDTGAQAFAKELGATWCGDANQDPPQKLDAAIIFAPEGALVPKALSVTDKGGTIVCGGIHMSDIPSFPYNLLWEERVVRSVANLARDDGKLLLEIAPKVPIKTSVQLFALHEANEALNALRSGNVKGAAVLVMPG